MFPDLKQDELNAGIAIHHHPKRMAGMLAIHGANNLKEELPALDRYVGIMDHLLPGMGTSEGSEFMDDAIRMKDQPFTQAGHMGRNKVRRSWYR